MENLREAFSKTWQIYPVFWFSVDEIQAYWQQLYMADTLRFRLCSIDEPTWADAKDMIMANNQKMFMVYDSELGRIVSEFALENFTGKAAQIHFSMHPENETKRSIKLAKSVTDEVLNEFTLDGKPYLDTLFGLTPKTNRAARLFNQMVGFKKIAELPNGIRDRGKIVDVVVTVKQRTV